MTGTTSELFARIEQAGFPPIFISSQQRQIQGEDSWRRFFAGRVSQYDAAWITAELDGPIAERQRVAATVADREVVDDPAGREYAEAHGREVVESAARAHAYRNSPEGRSELVIELLERIAKAIESQQTRR